MTCYGYLKVYKLHTVSVSKINPKVDNKGTIVIQPVLGKALT